MSRNPVDYAIGIDFGTTRTRVAYMVDENAGPMVVELTSRLESNRGGLSVPRVVGENSIPSVVAVKIPQDNEQKVFLPLEIEAGDEARALPNVYRQFARIKRLIGRGNLYQQNPEYNIGKDYKDQDYFVCPEGLVGYLLWTALKKVRESINLNAGSATVTVPARSTTGQRMATQFATVSAGFEGKVSVLEEPTAVFLYYYHSYPDEFRDEGCALVFDFGGGTCDISIIKYQKKGLPIVIARQMGEFGGEDIDDLIVALWLKRSRRFQNSYSVLRQNKPHVLEQLKGWACYAKEQLSSIERYLVEIPPIDPDFPGLIKRTLSRTDLVNLLQREPIDSLLSGLKTHSPIWAMIQKLLEDALEEGNKKRDDIDLVLMSGGSSHLAAVQKLIEQEFSGSKMLLRDPETSVVRGAAIYQFYKQHTHRSKREVIIPTLASDLALVYYHNPDNNDRREILLGERGSTLPIRCLNWPLGREKWIYDVEPIDGKILIRIVQQGQTLHEDRIEVGRTRVDHLRLRYSINEYGILEELECTPVSWVRGFFPKHQRLVKDRIEQNLIGTDFNLDNYSLTNRTRIEQLRFEYGIQRGG